MWNNITAGQNKDQIDTDPVLHLETDEVMQIN